MDMYHDVHLHNHNPHISSVMSPEEVWKRSKYSHSDLQNSHPWGCTEYVLEPILQDGNKSPKWMQRSRRAQYLGAYPLRAIAVGLVRNRKTGNISLKFHFVFDEYFETVHVGEDKKLPVWSELITLQYFKSAYDDKYHVPKLTDDWLDPEALEAIRHQESLELPQYPS